ncbi:hypothetical protein [Nonomuraea sp. JJY05]|uniref:hypothetical protein n=1 Tax=Nonomuraea sp. JJY05 TaxID=3350255 RepID=UPI00373F48A0
MRGLLRLDHCDDRQHGHCRDRDADHAPPRGRNVRRAALRGHFAGGRRDPHGADEPHRRLRLRLRLADSTGRLWVMSDNRHIALDSRAHRADPGKGTIAVYDVSGVVSQPGR